MKLFATLSTLIYNLAPNLLEIQLNPNFSENEMLRSVVKILGTIMIIAGLVGGAWNLWEGLDGQDPSKKRLGVTLIVGAIAIAGTMITLLNMVIV